jgi:hypothetical protein
MEKSRYLISLSSVLLAIWLVWITAMDIDMGYSRGEFQGSEALLVKLAQRPAPYPSLNTSAQPVV